MPPNLTNAPITEAVIDLRVRFDGVRQAPEFANIGSIFGADYPHSETRQNIEMQIDHEKKTQVVASTISGFLYRSTDGLQVFQSRIDGFSFSRLKPYTNWETFTAEANRLWSVYRETFVPKRVLRVATRFINRLEFPGPQIDFDDYLNTAPQLPKGVPQQLLSFNSTYTIPEIAKGTNAVVRQRFDPVGAAPDLTSVILDIDIIRDCDIDPNDNQVLWNEINGLRQIKNDVFFGSLKDKAVEVFK